MKTLASVVMFFLCSASQASDFRFCEMEGTVQASAPYPGKKARVFDLEVAVATARVDKSAEIDGCTDCSEFIGEVVEIRLQIPRRFAPPAAGDKITFKYSQIDGFDAGGNFAGTSINASLTDYQRPSTPPGR
ncbi:MAG: hypothetical protein JNM58_00025 [Xanthomonadaceae bacterium]|nr:hypothetical protein [Xanthomonadaceae bacterium]